MQALGSKALLDKALESRRNGRIDVVQLANNLGIDVFSVSKKDSSYNAHIAYVQDRNQFEIYVNVTHPTTRQRFSIAHELSHYAINPDKIIAKGTMDRSRHSVDQDEVDADKLAAKVLMPDELMEEYFKDNSLTEKSEFTNSTVEKIAEYFHVSRTMAVLRLREKGCLIPYLSFA
jgi:Zn-dependent peptidase ImmA (M78 family)